MVESAFNAMREIDANPDYILILGDSAAHYLSSWEENLAVIQNVSQTIAQYFPRAVVVPVLGKIFLEYYGIDLDG